MTDHSQRKIHIEWKRSGIGFTRRQRASIRGLGLRRLHDVVEREDTPQIRGLVAAVPHLVAVVDGPPKPAPWAALPEYTIHPPAKDEAPVKRAAKARKSTEASAAVAQEEGAPAKEASTKPAKGPKAAKAVSAKGKKTAAAKEPAKKKVKAAEKPAKTKASKGKK